MIRENLTRTLDFFFRRLAGWIHTREDLAVLLREVDANLAGTMASAPLIRPLHAAEIAGACDGRWAQMGAEVERRLAMGAVVMGIGQDGQIVHASWLCRDRLPIDRGAVLTLPPGTLGIFDMFTSVHARGRGYQRSMLSALVGDAEARRGSVALCATVHPLNRASLRSFTRTGFESIGLLTRTRTFGRGGFRLEAQVKERFARKALGTTLTKAEFGTPPTGHDGDTLK